MKPENYWVLSEEQIDHFRNVINELGAEFNSHDFLNTLRRIYPQDYSVYLARNHNNESQTEKHIPNLLSRHVKLFEIEKVLGYNSKEESENIRGEMKMAQLWRKIIVIFLFTVLSSSAFAELKIEKLKLPQVFYDDAPYADVMYNFSESMMRPVVISESGSKIEFTIWEIDFSTIYRQFTITLPLGYSYGWLPNLGYIGGRFADSDSRVILTQDLFNDDDLIEVVITCYGSNNKIMSFIINEHNEVLARSEEDVNFGYILDPALTGGLIITHNGYIVRKNSSYINEMSLDRHEGIVFPNPSRGANSLTISWGYTMLTDGRLNVIGIDGKLVHSQIVKSGASELNLAVSHLAAGTYIFIVVSGDHATTGKFIIE